MFSVASVCLSVCQHDNFQMIQRTMMKLGKYVHCTKIWPKFECQGQRSRSAGTKKTKNVAFSLGVILWGAVLSQFHAGGKIAHDVYFLKYLLYQKCKTDNACSSCS